MRDLAYDIAEHLTQTPYAALTQPALETARLDTLDTLGAALAGSSAPACAEIVDLVAFWGGVQQSQVMVFGGRVPAPLATLANTTMAHARELDDTLDEAVLHAGVTVVPAALAVAEALEADGQTTLRAIALGLDLVCRLGLACTAPPGPTGWVLTSNLGVFASAATAGMLLGLSESQMHNALGIAYCQAAGNMQAVADAAMTKRLQVGLAAQAGVGAAYMAARDISGAHEVFEGRHGYYKVYQRGRYDRNVVLNGLGTTFVHPQLSYKPYPSCRFTHGVIDAALRIAERVQPEDIESIEVALTSAAHHSIVEPIAAKQRPRTIVDAQFSAPYTAAVALLRREVRLEDFTSEAIEDARVLELASKVSCRADAQMDAERGRGISPALVTVHLRGGSVERERQDWPLGHPNTPLGVDGLIAKFRRCAAHAAEPIPERSLDLVIESCLGLEAAPRAAIVTELLVATRTLLRQAQDERVPSPSV